MEHSSATTQTTETKTGASNTDSDRATLASVQVLSAQFDDLKTTEQSQTTSPLELRIHTGSHMRDAPFFMCDTTQGLTVKQSQPSHEEPGADSILEVKLESKDEVSSGSDAADTTGTGTDVKVDKVHSVVNALGSNRTGPSLRKIYRDIRDSDHGFTVNSWQFLSVNEMIEHQDDFGGKMVDIALKYRGMGHVVALSYVPTTDKFIVRHDGGSNGYEREDNYNTYAHADFAPATFPCYMPNKADPSIESQTPDFFYGNLCPMTQYAYSDLMPLISPDWIL